MWNMNEKNMMFPDQSIGLNSGGPGTSFVENMKASSHVNSFNRNFLAETSRKRKAMGMDLGGDVSDCHTARYGEYLRVNSGNQQPRETSLQHTVSTFKVIGSQEIIESQEKYPEFSLLSAHSSNSGSYSGSYKFHNVNYSSMSVRKDDDLSQRAAVDGLGPQVLSHKENSLNKTSVGTIPNLPDSQQFAYDQSGQAGVRFMETVPVLRPKHVINWQHGNNNLPSNSCNITSHDFRYLESPDLKMDNDELTPNGGNYAQDFSTSEVTDVRRKSQDMGYGEHCNIPLNTQNFAWASAGCGREKSYESYQNPNSEKISVSNCSGDTGGAHLNYRVEEHSRPIMHQLQAIAESFDNIQAFPDPLILHNSGYVPKDLENRIVHKKNESLTETNKQSLYDGCPPNQDYCLDKGPPKPGDELHSYDLDEQNKSACKKAPPVNAEKLWDGLLQLNNSTRVSAVAFFKSGEKAQGINWSEHVEIKGKVRLEAFEKFIQELPRSRSRAMMVISLCWKVGSSENGLKGMKEVSKGYKEGERVGFAHVSPGIDLYVCPRSDTIITILAKYGFFKGMAAVEEDQDSLIGCVVWRRGQLASKSGPTKLETKENPLPEQCLDSPEPSTVAIHSPLTKTHDSESRHTTIVKREPDGVPSSLKSESKPIPNEIQSIKSIKESNKSCSSNPTTPGIAPLIACKSAATQVQRNFRQRSDLNCAEDGKEQAEICNNHFLEPKKPDLGFNPQQSVPKGPPEMSQEVQHANAQPSNTCFNIDAVPKLNFLESPNLSFQPPAYEKPNSNTIQNPVRSVAMAEFSNMNASESKELSTPFKMTTLPGPPPLPPEVLQRIMQYKRAKEAINSTSNIHTPIIHITELKSLTGPSLCGPPGAQAPQRLSNSDEDDDLPEYDFSLARGITQAPRIKLPSPSHENQLVDAPLLSKRLPLDVIKNAGMHKPAATPLLTPMEVMQKQQVSSFPGIAFTALKAGECISEDKPATNTAKPISELPKEIAVDIRASPRFDCSILKKNRWDDDDDDMPEWCPPDLVNSDQRNPSTTSKPFAEFSVQRPSIPAQASASFRPFQIQRFLQRDQAGLLGPCPASGSAQLSPPRASRLVPPDPRPLMIHHRRDSLRPQSSKFDTRPPSGSRWRLRRR